MRLALLRLLRLALRLRSRTLVLAPGPVLIVAPHPDDETFGCGGLVLLRRRAGLPVSILILTDGSASHPGHPTLVPAALAALRRDEAREAATRLGLAPGDLAFLDLPDGRLPHLTPAERENAIAGLAAHLGRLRPATVLVTHRRDGSSEHEAAFPLLAGALARAALRPRLLEYPVWAAFSPRLFFRRLLLAPARVRHAAFPGLGPAKARAAAAHASQLAPVPPWTAPALPRDFANAFSPETEFFLEMTP